MFGLQSREKTINEVLALIDNRLDEISKEKTKQYSDRKSYSDARNWEGVNLAESEILCLLSLEDNLIDLRSDIEHM